MLTPVEIIISPLTILKIKHYFCAFYIGYRDIINIRKFIGDFFSQLFEYSTQFHSVKFQTATLRLE